MTAADQTPASKRVVVVYPVDRSWTQSVHFDANDGRRKMHRTWPRSDDRYGTAACRSSVILNIEDAWAADDSRVPIEDLCHLCLPGGLATSVVRCCEHAKCPGGSLCCCQALAADGEQVEALDRARRFAASMRAGGACDGVEDHLIALDDEVTRLTALLAERGSLIERIGRAARNTHSAGPSYAELFEAVRNVRDIVDQAGRAATLAPKGTP